MTDEEPMQAAGSDGSKSDEKLTLGVCCMSNKVSSKPMQAILRRLELSGDFDIITFKEDMILNAPVEDWPRCECLIAFSSKGFPLDKCIQYCNLVNPVVVNNIAAQTILMDRCAVYRTLQEWGVPCPEHIVIDHTMVAPDGPNVLVEHDDGIVFNGRKLKKPFVEKPQDGDRHDIWVYYSARAGGGANKLFRKDKDKSSEFDPDQNYIRRDGTYSYEPFLPTQGTDIKVYTVGVGYVHAEARKAPTIDGKVERSKDGKEIRYPVVLTQVEKAISALIVKAFKQQVCGFDILRTDGGSIVCDVNGWSFVKGNQKYYNDCGVILRKIFLESTGRSRLARDSLMNLRPGDEEEINQHYVEQTNEDEEGKERLCCALVVMRHGDRRPKEKMKFKSKQPMFLKYFNDVEESEDKNKIGETEEVKLSNPKEMLTLLERTLATVQKLKAELAAVKEGERASAITSGGEDTAKACKSPNEKYDEVEAEIHNMELLIEVLEMQDRFSGFERKVQLKVSKWKGKDDDRRASQVLVVAKWGGELTHAGLMQAEQLGRSLRLQLYPNDPTGLLRLHSSFRHDFKIYSSQEGRCQITAAAFTKGFLDLEGDITPILVSLVTCDSFARGLLDEPIPKKQRDTVKQKIENLLTKAENLSSPEMIGQSCPTQVREDLRESARRIGEPLTLLHKLKDLMLEYVKTISDTVFHLTQELAVQGQVGPDESEGDFKSILHKRKGMVPCGPGPQVPSEIDHELKWLWLHLRRKEHRWRKLIHGFATLRDSSKDYVDGNVSWDVTKIPEVWDNIYYDMMTHRKELGEVSCGVAEKIIDLLQPLNAWVCSSEYGISQREKLRIGIDVCWRLIEKILVDLEFMIDDNIGSLTDEAGKVRSSDHSVEGSIGGSVETDSALELRPESPMGAEVCASTMDKGSPANRDSPSIPASPSGSGSVRSGQDSRSPPKITRTTTKDSLREKNITSQLRSALCDASDWHPRLAEEVARITGIKATQKVKSRIYVTSASTLHSLLNVLWHGNEDGSVKDNIITPSAGIITDLNYLTHIIFRCYEKEDCGGAGDEEDASMTPQPRERTFSPKSRPKRDRKVSADGNGQGETCDGAAPHLFAPLPREPSACFEDAAAVNGNVKGVCEKEVDDPSSPKALISNLREKLSARYRVEISVSSGMQVHKDGVLEQWPEGKDHRPELSQIAASQVVAHSVPLSKMESFLTEVVREYGARSGEESSEDEGGSA